MPIYEYQCEKCSQIFEALIIGSDSEPPACEKCGSRRVKRRISAANTIGVSAAKTGSACSAGRSSGFS